MTGEAEESDPLGLLEILVDALRIRQTPTVSGEERGKADKGDIYRVYEVSSSEGYTWYRIGHDAWIADKDGKYSSFRAD